MSFQTSLSSAHPSLTQAVDAFRYSITTSNPAALEQSLWKQWRELLQLVSTVAQDKQENLVAFIQELRKQDNPEKEDGEKVEIWGEEFRWENLPILGPTVREFWDTTEPDPSTCSAEDQQKWINQNAFLAHLTSRSVTPNDSLDFSLYGIWALRSAFEDPAELASSHAMELEAGSVWLLYAGVVLRGRSEEGQNWEGKIAREGFKCRADGKDWSGLCMERWGVWRNGIQKSLEGEETTTTTGETRRLLEAALKEMGDS